jgi:peptidoglycan hydrolase CwlO-like protein
VKSRCPNDCTVATLDADGEALAAIQGLNQKVEEQRAALEQKETEITKLKGEMAELKRLVGSLTQKLSGGDQ